VRVPIADAVSLPYGALSLPLAFSVFCRADFRSCDGGDRYMHQISSRKQQRRLATH